MRHGRKTVKLQRPAAHRNALLSNLVVNLIEQKQIRTTLAKAKAVRPLAERMVTLAKKGDLHARRTALSYLRQNKKAVKELFDKIGPASISRVGGYTRITKLGQRLTDSAPMAFIEWVDTARPAPVKRAEKPAAEETAGDEPAAAEEPKKAAPKKKKAEAAPAAAEAPKPKKKAAKKKDD